MWRGTGSGAISRVQRGEEGLTGLFMWDPVGEGMLDGMWFWSLHKEPCE